MAVLKIEGAAIGYQDVPGPGGPPFVLIHDWLADRGTWAPHIQDLSRSYRCVAVDLPGSGESPSADRITLEASADYIAAVMRHLELPPAIIVGHGAGALIALVVNRRHPELLCGTVLCDPWLTPVEDGTLAAIASAVREAGTVEPATRFVEGVFGPGTPEAHRKAVREALASAPADRVAGLLESAATLAPDLDALLRAADARPFMALWPGSPMGNPDALRKTTVFLRQEPVPASSHTFVLERPRETCVLLRAFVDDVERDPRLNPAS